ncbi:MAG: leucine-rich repeat protein [Muribaculaceae bacterium]|nr:leucine-rich repeat protein [Muribaculaceae bacterium]
MKSLIKTIFLLLALLLPATAAAHDIEVDGIYYNIYGNEAAVTYEGDDYDSNPNRYSGEVSIPETVTYDGVTYAVTAIDPEAFFYCNYMTSVTIPGSVTRINLSAFLGCRGLKSITIPGSVTHIDRQAFAYCSKLTALAIPASVSYIGYRAFDGCTGFQSITVDSGNRWYDSRDNCNALIETATNTLIAGCKNTIIPNTVTSIGDNAFDGLTDLTHITIPNSVTSIGHNAFHSCKNLTEITIPNSVTSIGGCAFASCSSLTSVTIPSSVTFIDSAPFVGCSGLTSIAVESGNPNYDSREDCNALIETTTNTLIAGCKNTIIPNTITFIGGYAFSLCAGLMSVTIPASVTSIGENAFYSCKDLMDVYCHITNPSSVMVEYHAFYSDNNNSDRTLHVPYGTLEAYRTDENWYPYFGQIVEMEPETDLKGDVNNDGEVNIADVNAAVDIILGGYGDFHAADVNGDGEVTIADINAIMDIILGGGSPSQDDHEYVDLGLPSGTLWATCNIGANSPEEYGDYFAWGETAPKGDFTWETYKWCNGSDRTMTKYCTKSSYGTIDNKTELEPEDDAACAYWGSSWRMPSQEQIDELMSHCSHQSTTLNGVNGMLVTGPNGNSIFLPSAGAIEGSTRMDAGLYGHYWSRTLDPDSNRFANTLFTIPEAPGVYYGLRDHGFCVRPVRAPQN